MRMTFWNSAHRVSNVISIVSEKAPVGINTFLFYNGMLLDWKNDQIVQSMATSPKSSVDNTSIIRHNAELIKSSLLITPYFSILR